MLTCPVCQGQFDNATFCPRDGSRLEVAGDTGALLGGRYRLIRRVGEGAMGVVFEGEHVSIRRRVAVKILQRSLLASPEMVERLRREAQVTSGLGHPNIVECLDFGSEDGQVYLVMEWLEGENLDQRLAREQVSIDAALDIGAQTCAGLAEAHDRGVIHRDLKPANLFLTSDRSGNLRVKILDFGIAKLAAAHTQLTSTGVLVGTPNYMAPEQALGEAIDARADIYALGVILYEVVAGRVPFLGDTPLAVLHQHTTKLPAPPSAIASSRTISSDIDTVVMRCLAKAPGDRYQTMAELAAAIDRLRVRTRPMLSAASAASNHAPQRPDTDEEDDEPAALRPRRGRALALAIGGLALLALGGLGVFLLVDDKRTQPVQAPADVFVPSSVVDAFVIDAAPPGATSVDAARPDEAPMDAAVEPSFVVRSRTPRYAIETHVSPKRVQHDVPATLAITLTELDADGRGALATGRVTVRVTVVHFARHGIVTRETIAVDANGRATLDWVPRRGRHHVSIEPLVERTSLGRTRFDVHAE